MSGNVILFFDIPKEELDKKTLASVFKNKEAAKCFGVQPFEINPKHFWYNHRSYYNILEDFKIFPENFNEFMREKLPIWPPKLKSTSYLEKQINKGKRSIIFESSIITATEYYMEIYKNSCYIYLESGDFYYLENGARKYVPMEKLMYQKNLFHPQVKRIEWNLTWK